MLLGEGGVRVMLTGNSSSHVVAWVLVCEQGHPLTVGGAAESKALGSSQPESLGTAPRAAASSSDGQDVLLGRELCAPLSEPDPHRRPAAQRKEAGRRFQKLR